MKKNIKIFYAIIFLLLANLMIGFNVFACEDNNFVCEFDENLKVATITDFKNLNATNIVVPEKINNYTVTKIAKSAFGKQVYKKWESIKLPNSIQEIDEKAFSCCFELKEVKLPTSLKKIGENCFQFCYNLENLFIPNSVSYIGEEAFYGCVSLKNVNIPNSLKVLPKRLFKHCISLQGLNIHENIQKIDKSIFDDCGINLDLDKFTTIDVKNLFYKKEGNAIIDKQSGDKIINFAISDESYTQKLEEAKKIYTIMENFMNKYKKYSASEFDEQCTKYMTENSKAQKIITKEEFEKNSEDKLLLYRGMSKKYAADFEIGKLFITSNMCNEHGCGIYTAPEFEHAEEFASQGTPEDWKLIEKYVNDTKLYEEMFYKYVYGKVTKMYLDPKSNILNNQHLKECKDLIFKMYPEKFRCAASFMDKTLPEERLKTLNIFNTKCERLFHNSGLLTKLLGYDALYEKETQMLIDEENDIYGSEYLVVNPEILNVCKDS